MWEHWVCDTMTGARLARFYPDTTQWQRLINQAESGQVTIPVDSIGDGASVAAKRASRRDLLAPWARTLVGCYAPNSSSAPQPVWAGIIQKPVYDRDSRKITVTHAGLRVIFKKRIVFDDTNWGDLTATSYTNLSPNDAVARITGWGHYPAGSFLNLPFRADEDGKGGTFSRAWKQFWLTTVEEAVTDVQNATDGPDIDLVPAWGRGGQYWSPIAGGLTWALRAGALTGPQLDFHMASDKPGLTSTSSTQDGTSMVTKLWTYGQGSEADALLVNSIGSAGGDDVPTLSGELSLKQDADQAVLLSHSDEYLRANNRPQSTFAATMLASGTPGLLDLAIGQPIRTYFENDPWEDDGWVSRRLLGYSGTMAETVDLTLQDIEEAA